MGGNEVTGYEREDSDWMLELYQSLPVTTALISYREGIMPASVTSIVNIGNILNIERELIARRAIPNPEHMRPKHRLIMKYMQEYFVNNDGNMPTHQEIQTGAVNSEGEPILSSTSAVSYNLKLMGKEGYITMRKGQSRGVTILQPVD